MQPLNRRRVQIAIPLAFAATVGVAFLVQHPDPSASNHDSIGKLDGCYVSESASADAANLIGGSFQLHGGPTLKLSDLEEVNSHYFTYTKTSYDLSGGKIIPDGVDGGTRENKYVEVGWRNRSNLYLRFYGRDGVGLKFIKRPCASS